MKRLCRRVVPENTQVEGMAGAQVRGSWLYHVPITNCALVTRNVETSNIVIGGCAIHVGGLWRGLYQQTFHCGVQIRHALNVSNTGLVTAMHPCALCWYGLLACWNHTSSTPRNRQRYRQHESGTTPWAGSGIALRWQ